MLLVAGCGGVTDLTAGAPVPAATGPVRIDALAPVVADRRACRQLLQQLPRTLADLSRRAVHPDDAWGAAWGDPAVVLTCRSRRPAGFDRLSSCTTVNGVDWFIPEAELESHDPVALTMTTVHRRPFVQVVLPPAHFPPAAVLADLTRAVRDHTTRTGACV